MNMEGAMHIDLTNLKLNEHEEAREEPRPSSADGNPDQTGSENTVRNLRVENLLNTIIDNNYESNKVTEERLKMVDHLVQTLQNKLREHPNYGEHTRVNIIGSLANGLGTNSSDVDLCVRLKEDELPALKREELKDYVYELIEPLKSIGCSKIEPIINCRVPIIKFQWIANVETTIEVDISFYNILSLHNTALIKKYCEWEPERLPKLTLFIKKWAKRCNIGSAFQGGLSSYGYVLLAIYYLQNIEPPVLPRLQEQDFQDDDYVREIVDGANVFFQKTVMPNWSTNTSSVAELFIGFMGFYAEFPHSEKLISIRGKTSSKIPESSIFTSRIFRIEDPFDVNHNLGKVVRKSMAEFIMRTQKKTHEFLSTGLGEHLLEKLEMEDNINVADRIIRFCMAEEVAPIRKLGNRKPRQKRVPNQRPAQVNNPVTRYPMRPQRLLSLFPPPPPGYFPGPPPLMMYPPPFGCPHPTHFNPYDFPPLPSMGPPPTWVAPHMTRYPPNQNRGGRGNSSSNN